MKTNQFILTLFIVLSYLSSSFSQSHAHLERYTDNELTVDNFFQKEQNALRTAPDAEFKLTKKLTDRTGKSHYRFKQSYQGIPVYGKSYVLHEKEGIVHSANGALMPTKNVNTQAQLSSEDAITQAKRHMSEEGADNLESQNVSLQFYDTAFPNNSNTYRLSYVIELHSELKHEANQYIVDAQNGKILNVISLIHEQGVPAKGLTSYYGEKEFIVDSLAPDLFTLHDPTRGQGITTFTQINQNPEIVSNTSNEWDFSDRHRGTVAIDVHWATQGFYDMLIEKLNWDGLDNNGRAMHSHVHYAGGSSFVNAFWNGDHSTFGDGDCNYGALTSIDVVGHEFTHGITQETANLIYANESGAINESMSDVLGKALEYYLNPDEFSWVLGAEFSQSPFTDIFRNMEDPASLGMPDFYKGSLWIDGNGVHTNSAIGNLWFQTLVDGGTGTNELGDNFTVEGIGMYKALEIAFTCLSSYLNENSDYPAYYEFSLEVTKDLYGEGSTEYNSVSEAWKAVGLNEAYVDDPNLDIFDLQVVNDGGFFTLINTCIESGFYPFTIQIFNNSSTDYIPNSFDELVIFSSQTINYPLTEIIPAGDTLTIEFNEVLFFDDRGNESISAQLIAATDETLGNNSTFFFVQNEVSSELDFSMFLTTETFSCQDNTLEYDFFIVNESCATLEANEDYKISVYSNGGTLLLHEQVFTAATSINPSAAITNTVRINSNLVEQNMPIQFILELEGETNTINNQFETIVLGISETTNEQFTNSFSSISDLSNNIQYFSFNSENLISYQGESYFATTGDNFPQLCADPFATFSAANGGFGSSFQTQINLCLDLSNVPQPALVFDMIQFRDELEDYPDIETSVCKLTIASEDYELNEFIYDLEEGELNNFLYELPDGFKGEVILQFYNSQAQGDYFTGDVFLLDNLGITGTVATEDEEIKTGFANIYPNPVRDLLNLKLSKEAEQYSVTNAQGKLVKTDKILKTDTEINLQDLNHGYYFLSISYKDNTREIVPFVHLDY